MINDEIDRQGDRSHLCTSEGGFGAIHGGDVERVGRELGQDASRIIEKLEGFITESFEIKRSA
jgi:hypothetical protein